MLNIAVTQGVLDGAGVMAGAGELGAAGALEHVRVDGEGEEKWHIKEAETGGNDEGSSEFDVF